MKRFLESVADFVCSDLHQNHSVLVIVPNIRSGVFLKHYIHSKINQTVFAPDIYSSEEFANMISELEPIENFDSILRLYTIYCSNNDLIEKPSIEDFFSFAYILISDFDEIDRYCVDAEKLFKKINDLISTSNLYEKLKKLWLQAGPLYYSFKDYLISHGLAYTGLRYRTMLEKITSTKLSYDTVYWIGLYALTQSEKKLFYFFREQYASRFKVFLDLDSYFIENDLQEAGAIYRDFWKKQLVPEIKNDFANSTINIHAIAVQGTIGIVKCAGSILADIFNKKPDIDPASVAIVFSDESLLIPMLNTIPEQIKEFNVTMGLPLTMTKIYSFLSLLFEVYNSMQITESGVKEIDSAALYELIEHSYIEMIFTNNENQHTNIKNTITDYISKNYSYISISNIESIPILFNFLISNDGIYALEAIKNIITVILKNAHEQKLMFEKEIIFAGWELINKTCDIIHESNIALSVHDLGSILNTLFLSKTIAFRGEPLKGLQLMGMLETQCLDFSILFMLSANEGFLPFTGTRKSFIPEIIRKDFGLPSQTNSEEVTAYHFYRLISHADSVYLIYSESNENFGKNEKSRFIYQLKYEYAPHNHNCTFTEKTFEYTMYKQTSKPITVTTNESIKNDLLTIKYSPSAIACYIECSLKFYYTYILKLKPFQELQEDPDAAMIGKIFHTSLQRLFLPKKYFENDLHLLKNKIPEVVNDVIESFLPNTTFTGNHYVLKKAAVYFLEQYIDACLQQSKHRRETNDTNVSDGSPLFSIIAIEQNYTYTLPIANDRTVTIKGTIDRIEAYEDKTVIIDFKTGAVKGMCISGNNFDELFKSLHKPIKKQSLQLLWYALLFQKSHTHHNKKTQETECTIYSFKGGKGFKPLTIKLQKQIIPINTNLLENFENWLKQLLQGIIDTPNFTQTADRKTCELCPYNTLCMKL